ncbi:ScbA/BarX family gamma-butyrolactone biosynthesis protein, partial [[Kitasatospora] papulosa]|uniref:ScbA/BarX family gamma-butyrolactone biosynthesis protein n=1 Tax=[Kitasatospora] papulosa TaxID=1464011 RepID=UPI0036797927
MSASTFRIDRTLADAFRTGNEPTGNGNSTYPSLTTTVPKEFVHRASVAEVMLTDWARHDDHRFTVTAQWPRGHSFYTNIDDCHDPLIAAETIRQAGILLAHAEFGVPLDRHFLVWDLAVSVRPEHMRVGWQPASLELGVTCSSVKRRGRELSGFRVSVDIRRDGELAGTGGGSLACLQPAVYRRLRAPHLIEGARPRVIPLTAPVPPQTVGRSSPVDVVLSPAGRPHLWRLRVDTGHPVLFDHPLDHVPGMLLLEAARQATAARLGRSYLPLDITSEFKRFTELDAPCLIEAERVAGSGSAHEQSRGGGRPPARAPGGVAPRIGAGRPRPAGGAPPPPAVC